MTQTPTPMQELDDMQTFAAWLAGDIQPGHAVPVEQEDACGLWRDRPEMDDSAAYVRALRQTEWEGRHAADR